jgi:hypothetical protein
MTRTPCVHRTPTRVPCPLRDLARQRCSLLAAAERNTFEPLTLQKAVMLFERYADRDNAYLKVHKESDEFKKFRPALAALEPEIDGTSYWESAGFMAREEGR